jgi:hypothetical protein
MRTPPQRSKGAGENDPAMNQLRRKNPGSPGRHRVIRRHEDTSARVFDNKLGVNLAVSKEEFVQLGAENMDNVDLRVEPYAVYRLTQMPPLLKGRGRVPRGKLCGTTPKAPSLGGAGCAAA